jgi:hypothetical protein
VLIHSTISRGLLQPHGKRSRTMPLLSTQLLGTWIYIRRNQMEARHWTKGGTSAGGKGGWKGEIFWGRGENTWQRACAAEGTKWQDVKYCRSRLWHPQDVTYSWGVKLCFSSLFGIPNSTRESPTMGVGRINRPFTYQKSQGNTWGEEALSDGAVLFGTSKFQESQLNIDYSLKLLKIHLEDSSNLQSYG